MAMSSLCCTLGSCGLQTARVQRPSPALIARGLSGRAPLRLGLSGCRQQASAARPLLALGSEGRADSEWLGDEAEDPAAAAWGDADEEFGSVAVAGEPAANSKVFVANVPWSTSRKELGYYFQEQCGAVADVNLLMGRDGRPKGIAFVEFESPDSAAAAVETLHGVEFEGRTLVVEMATPREEMPKRRERRDDYESGPTESARLWVSSLSYDTDWTTLKDYFKEAGEVVYASVSQRPDGSSKGCGIVEMSSVEQAQAAIDMLNGSELDGRNIYVREDRKAYENRGSPHEGSESWGRAQNRNQNGRPGDWVCDSCGALVFASKHECFKCGAPKTGNEASGESYGGGGGDGGYDGWGEQRRGGRGGRGGYQQREKPEFRDGDWNCAECGAHVFASKSECFRCGAAKPF